MEHFYISSKNGISGICKYSRDFYELVLKEKGYTFIDSREDLSTIFTKVPSRANVHIEIGIFQQKEIEILFLMLKAKYQHVSITLHDAPLLKYPIKQFNNVLLNRASKFYDRFIVHFNNSLPYIRKLKAIYVLSMKGVEETKRKYKVDNVHYLPHVLDPKDIIQTGSFNRNFLYFGFIGQNKGIEYALKLHASVMQQYVDIQFYVIGTAIGKEIAYYNYLKKKYARNVHYLGYVQEADLQQYYDKADFALSLFRNYKFFYPTSGSVLYNLKKGMIVLATNVNTIDEVIVDGQNGIHLTGQLRHDTERIISLYDDTSLQAKIRKNAYAYLLEKHVPEKVGRYLME
jgi:glycosyltransferase involved in cell wall biosynthesis